MTSSNNNRRTRPSYWKIRQEIGYVIVAIFIALLFAVIVSSVIAYIRKQTDATNQMTNDKVKFQRGRYPSTVCVINSPARSTYNAEHIRKTWAKDCTRFVVYNSNSKTSLFWTQLFNRKSSVSNDATEWVIKADDDTFIYYDNLMAILRRLDPRQPYYFSRFFAFDKNKSMSFHFVMSRGLLDQLVATDNLQQRCKLGVEATLNLSRNIVDCVEEISDVKMANEEFYDAINYNKMECAPGRSLVWPPTTTWRYLLSLQNGGGGVWGNPFLTTDLPRDSLDETVFKQETNHRLDFMYGEGDDDLPGNDPANVVKKWICGKKLLSFHNLSQEQMYLMEYLVRQLDF